MKILIAVTCLALVILVGEHFWSGYQDDKFQLALAEIAARDAANGASFLGQQLAR